MADHSALLPSVSFSWCDQVGRRLASHQPETVYYAASTIKLGIALAVGRAVAAGDLSLRSVYGATRSFEGASGERFCLTGDHLDPEFPADGTDLSVADLCRLMISRSSNEATNILLGAVGIDAVAQVFADLRLGSTRVERLIGDPAAQDEGLTNETTAGDLTKLMRATVTGDLGPGRDVPRDVVSLFVEALEAQTIPPIGRSLASGIRWGSKSGEVPGYRHDVAFIGDPGSEDCRYLAVCTQGYEENAADEVIAGLVAALGLGGN
ncbi:serine hydrolase [Rothia koreensis]|uniref:serine hydrolase n=1 Tax=Rothia koreensis TaxID=592378 RepID=UPI0037C7D2C9